MNNLPIAKSYFDAGLNIIPVKTDGSKSPCLKWRDGSGQIQYPWYRLQHYFGHNGSGIGIVCGNTSNNVEVLDFDDFRYFPMWEGLVSLRYPSLMKELPIVETPSGGRHIYYRCPEIEGNIVLARDEAEHILIETRGQGGMAVAPGSPLDTHPERKPYRLRQGDLTNVPTILPEQRSKMLDTARGFNRSRPKPRSTSGLSSRPQERLLCELYGDNWKPRERPGDAFNNRADWRDVLEPHGWTALTTRGDVTYWRKPDSKGAEHHATTNYNGSDLLYVFSTDVKGLEAQKAYTKFAVYAILQFAGDYSSAAQQLSREGFGRLSERSKNNG